MAGTDENGGLRSLRFDDLRRAQEHDLCRSIEGRPTRESGPVVPSEELLG